VVDLTPISRADVRPGERIIATGTEGKDGGMDATTLIVGGSPIVGFEN